MQILAIGLQVPEGPALDAAGQVMFTEQTAGRISRLGLGGVEEVAFVGGAPNSCALGDDGSVYVCQNGGVVGAWRSTVPRTPGIQRINVDGSVRLIAKQIGDRRLGAPNDLAFAADGTLCFTDPAQPFDPRRPTAAGSLYAINPMGVGNVLFDTGGVYCNGIGFAPDGTLLWVESYTRRVCALTPDGRRTVLCQLPAGQIPDGFAVASDGRLFIASCGSHGISVVGPEGDYLGLIVLDEDANPTNLCFLGDSLIVTDFGMDFQSEPGAGRLWQVPVDAVGAPVHVGRIADEGC